MALYAIGDLHLSLTADKPMEVFGPAWENYTERIGDALSRLTAGDVLVLAGDTSWGIDLNEAEADFRFLDQFPCKKYLVKGNHDYWWSTVSKMKNFFTEKGLTTLDFLHNNCALYGDYALCGTRGWFFEEDQKPHNAKVLNREVGRLETSLKAAEDGPSSASFTIRRCIRATSARRSCGCSRPTPWSGAATATSTATPSNGGWRAGGMGRTSP